MQTGRVLVTGAGGLVGRGLVGALCADGVPTRLLLRRPPADAGPGPEVVVGDLRDPAACAAAVADVELVVHAAGVMHSTAAEPADFDAVNRAGTLALAGAAAAAGARRLVFLSSVAVYGDGDLDGADEDHPLAPSGPYGESKRAAEEQLLALSRDTGLEVVVLRPCGVYAPGESPFLEVLVARCLAGELPAALDPTVPLGLVHRDDVLQAVRLAATVPGAAGRTYNVAEGVRRPLGEVLDGMAEAAFARGLRVPPRSGGPDPMVTGMVGRARYVSVDRARRELGYAPARPLPDGLAAVLDAVLARGSQPCSS